MKQEPITLSLDTKEHSPAAFSLLYAAFFKTRGLLIVPWLFVMFFVTRGERGSGVMNWTIGLTLFGAAFALRIRSQQYLRYRLKGNFGLATAGPYAHIRNPVYVAAVMALGGLCILCRLYWMAPIAMAWTALVYDRAIRFEELRLMKVFGEPYRRYLERVPRWIPRRSIDRTPNADRASLWQAVGVEWQALLLLLVPLGKEWVRRPHGGSVHAGLAQFPGFVVAHGRFFIMMLAIVLVVLAACNSKAALAAIRKNRTMRGAVAARVAGGRGQSCPLL